MSRFRPIDANKCVNLVTYAVHSFIVFTYQAMTAIIVVKNTELKCFLVNVVDLDVEGHFPRNFRACTLDGASAELLLLGDDLSPRVHLAEPLRVSDQRSLNDLQSHNATFDFHFQSTR